MNDRFSRISVTFRKVYVCPRNSFQTRSTLPSRRRVEKSTLTYCAALFGITGGSRLPPKLIGKSCLLRVSPAFDTLVPARLLNARSLFFRTRLVTLYDPNVKTDPFSNPPRFSRENFTERFPIFWKKQSFYGI